MTWSEANDHCKAEEGKLVEIDSEGENTALFEEITRRRLQKSDFWMGITDEEIEGDWRLKSTGLKPSFLNWFEDEPNDLGNEDCALLSGYNGN